MKHFYQNFANNFRVTFLLAALAVGTITTAQNSTGSTRSTNCGIIRENFDLGNGGYTSPSLYGDQRRDSSFYYNQRRGFWTELGEDARERTNPPSRPRAGRLVSILSTSYPSPTTEGAIDVGFVYVVPDPAVDLFAVSLVRLVTTPAPGGFDETTASTVAVSGFKTFLDFSSATPAVYNDPFGNAALTGQRGVICMRLVDADITVGSNVRYRVDVTYEIATAGTFTVFDDLSLNNVTESSPLPVDFIGMLVKRNNKTAEIRWDIANQVNVKEYQVEKSIDGRTFDKIGSVGATSNSLYSYTDGAPGAATVLYRIKSVDIDGKSKYSSVVRLNGLSSYANILKLYPLPARNEVTVEHKKLAPNAKITISTVDGKVMKVVTPINGSSHTPLNLTGYMAGLYIVRVDDGEGSIESIKLIKQ